jgi:hypothetical protein
MYKILYNQGRKSSSSIGVSAIKEPFVNAALAERRLEVTQLIGL